MEPSFSFDLPHTLNRQLGNTLEFFNHNFLVCKIFGGIVIYFVGQHFRLMPLGYPRIDFNRACLAQAQFADAAGNK